MNKGFTKLEIILIGIILFAVFAFIAVKNPNLFASKENLLKQRYSEFVSLLNDKNYKGAYNYYSASIKNDGSLEDFIKSSEKNAVGKQEVTVNKIVIKGETGYIDRNNTACGDVSCNNKKDVRGYRRWIFENGTWFYSPPDPLCIQDKPYKMPSEFSRAYELLAQRLEQSGLTINKESADYLNKIKNCVDIQYSSSDTEMNNAEGFFRFNEDGSLDDLKITVSPRYVVKDDIITAILLSHELMHVGDYLSLVNDGVKIDCFEAEAEAFQQQNYFMTILNQEEKDSIIARYQYGASQELGQIVDVNLTIPRYSGNSYYEKALNYVKDSSYYQKECSLN